jgi:hypothetical protein
MSSKRFDERQDFEASRLSVRSIILWVSVFDVLVTFTNALTTVFVCSVNDISGTSSCLFPSSGGSSVHRSHEI